MKTLILLLCVMAMAVGCETVKAIQSDERAQYKAACEVFRATVDSLTELRAQGAFTQEQADKITSVIGKTRIYLSNWNKDLLAGRHREGAYVKFSFLLGELEQYRKGDK